MITVDYELYTNDYSRSYRKETFYDLNEFVDWVFQNCDGKYEKDISVPSPECKWLKEEEMPYSIDVNRMWTRNNHLWIHQIRKDSTIIFSDGTHTNHIRHWNEETKQMCRDMLNRIKNPVFNFG